MNWQWLLLFLTCHTLINAVENKEVVAQINTKRLIHYVPDRFLSMTIDPTSLFLAGTLEQKALKMARGLYPSFVRLGGKATNYLKFGKELFVDNNTITEDQWDGVNHFVEDAGLDLIVSLNPTHRVQGVWDSRDALQLISYSDKHGYNVAWQLGYDTQGHQATGGEVGRDIIRLRKILDGFQRYATTPLFGPDLPDIYTLKESAFIKDILVQAGPVLGAIVVQMPFNNENPEQKISNILFNMESHIWSREIRYGRMIPKKPIWIAEKYPSHGSIEDAITLAKYLGTAAQIGCQMVFRQVGPESLKNPTPDYWFALLYKNLVGRGVFDAKVTSGNKSEIVLFSHCSPPISQERSILDTGFNYDKGSVTVFGVNESPDTVKLTLKASMKDEKAHIYFLTFEDDPNGKTEKTFLNGQLLTSSPSGDLPIISPKIKRTIKYGITVPPRSIFFIVLPDLKSRTCTSSSPYLSPDVQSLSKKLIHVVADALEKPSNDVKSEEEDPQNVYVKFAKTTGMQNLAITDNKPSQVQEDSEPDVQVKYITFNDNSWLSKLTETMGNSKVYEQSDQNASNANSEDKYPTLTAAITGSDNLTAIALPDSESSIVLPDPESSIVLPDLESSNEKRKKRSVHEQLSIDPDQSTGSGKNNVASQEDLVKHLNEYASTVYKKSKDEPNKEIQISNIPPLIFETLKKVKVTFKNLDKNSPKHATDNTNTNGSPLIEKTEEDSKDATPLNDYLISNDGSFVPVISDSEKGIADPTISKNKELYHYKVETLRNNERAPIDVNQKDIQNLDENNYQESNDANDKKIDPVITNEPFQGKEAYQGRIAKQQDSYGNPIEITDKSQEGIQAELDEKYTDQENIPSEILTSNQEKSGEAVELGGEKLKIDESPFSQNQESISETKETGTNYILNNMPVVTAMNLNNVEEPEKNIILLPINSVDQAVSPNLVDEQDGTDEQLRAGTDYDEKKSESNHDTSEMNDGVSLTKFNKKQDNELLNGEDEQEKVISRVDDAEKENLPSINGIISDAFYKSNGGEKKIKNEDYIDGDELLLVKSKDSLTNTKPLVYIPQQSSSEESKSSSLLLPMTIEQQGLGDGPPLPSYNADTVKVVQRAIPLNENMPIFMVPIMEPEEQLQENNEEETKVKNPAKSSKIIMNGGDIPDITNPDSISDRVGKDASNEGTFSPSSSQASENTMKLTDTKVESFADVPLENTVERSYGKTLPIINNNHNLLSSLQNQITLENIKKDIQELEAISNDSHEKRAVPKTDETYSTEEISMPVLIMTPQGELQPLEKSIYTSDMGSTMLPQFDTLPLKMSEVTDEKPDYSLPDENINENSPDTGERDEGKIDQYKLLEKSVPVQEVSNNKPDMVDKTEKSKADLEKERREKLLLLKKQIAEIRENFRAQVREEGLKAALQRREEEMRNYLNQEKELKKKLFAYPLVNHDHNILSRPRRLSYFPESDISGEEDCDYLDQKTYKRRTDSYGVPIIDDYEKSYLTQQVISAPLRNADNNHILFPLDPKTPQALVYDDKIIPAKFFGVLSMNEESSGTKSNNIANRQILDLPVENACQKCLIKQYDPHSILKESYNPKISEASFETYSLPKDTYIKSNNQPNYIPIVVLSTPIKNHRKRRSIDVDNLRSRRLSKRDIKQEADLKKRSIEQIPPFERNTYLDRSYDYLNEIPIETDNHLNNIDYIHPNDMTIHKSNDISVDKFPKGFPEFLPLNNLPTDYIQSRQNLFQDPPNWSDVKVTNDMEPRHFLEPLHPPSLVHPPSVVHPIIPEEHSQEKDSPKFYFWSLMHNKFKSVLEMLKSLAEWCSSSSRK
ncbi:unnamed protein product [Nezara viridula]|uniref:Heparanase n=1 Tax=Nezara viridula TaxID=85310 RepID=A0A9P0HKJ0_NEZVI|nr:unnamed protein product [Nezara viridula]